jgi:hypothetical protein
MHTTSLPPEAEEIAEVEEEDLEVEVEVLE